MSVTAILAIIAGLLALLSIFPFAERIPLLSVAALLLSIAVFLAARGTP